MESIKDIIPQVIEELTVRKPDDRNKIQRIWQNVTDVQTARHSALLDFSDGVLTVAVDSSARLYQMNLKRKKFLEQLQEEIPDIQQIQFKIGKVP